MSFIFKENYFWKILCKFHKVNLSNLKHKVLFFGKNIAIEISYLFVSNKFIFHFNFFYISYLFLQKFFVYNSILFTTKIYQYIAVSCILIFISSHYLDIFSAACKNACPLSNLQIELLSNL